MLDADDVVHSLRKSTIDVALDNHNLACNLDSKWVNLTH